MLFVLIPIGAFAFLYGLLSAIAEIVTGPPGAWRKPAFVSAAGFALLVSMVVMVNGGM